MNAEQKDISPVYVVSGSAGASGEQLVHTVLAQFPGNQVPVITVGHLCSAGQLEQVVDHVKTTGGVIVHTLVENSLREQLVQQAREQGVLAIDVMGDLLTHLSEMLGQKPAEEPGLYRQLHQDYFERVEAIELTLDLNDGKRPQDWAKADIVLVGVSRVGKTPLSMYLSVVGWKVANVPLILDIPPAPELFELDHRRVIGLKIEPDKLLLHRQKRQDRLGVKGKSQYVDLLKIYEEMEYAQKIFKRGRFSSIDVTDKPIETTANEVIRFITRRFGVKQSASSQLP